MRTRAVVEMRVDRLAIVRPIQAAYHRDKRVTLGMKHVMELIRNVMRSATDPR